MSEPGWVSRREFMNRLAPAWRSDEVLELSCERLYMQYVDARAEGRLPEFLQGLRAVIRSAGGIRVLQPEWLSREDFRRDVERLLHPTAAETRVTG